MSFGGFLDNGSSARVVADRPYSSMPAGAISQRHLVSPTLTNTMFNSPGLSLALVCLNSLSFFLFWGACLLNALCVLTDFLECGVSSFLWVWFCSRRTWKVAARWVGLGESLRPLVVVEVRTMSMRADPEVITWKVDLVMTRTLIILLGRRDTIATLHSKSKSLKRNIPHV